MLTKFKVGTLSNAFAATRKNSSTTRDQHLKPYASNHKNKKPLDTQLGNPAMDLEFSGGHENYFRVYKIGSLPSNDAK